SACWNGIRGPPAHGRVPREPAFPLAAPLDPRLAEAPEFDPETLKIVPILTPRPGVGVGTVGAEGTFGPVTNLAERPHNGLELDVESRAAAPWRFRRSLCPARSS